MEQAIDSVKDVSLAALVERIESRPDTAAEFWLVHIDELERLKEIASVVQPALLAADRVDAASEMLSWIKKKLGLSESASESDIYGAMHVWDARQSGYTNYIESYKCADKQGEIARLSKEVTELRLELERAAKTSTV